MTNKKNILIVDDDRIANFLSEKIISVMGIANTIQSVTNGKEALDVLNRYHDDPLLLPNVIILDLNMPIMDGFQFIETFKELELAGKEKILIIVVTSSNNPGDIAKAAAFGIKHYLTKPISLESIKSIIEDLK